MKRKDIPNSPPNKTEKKKRGNRNKQFMLNISTSSLGQDPYPSDDDEGEGKFGPVSAIPLSSLDYFAEDENDSENMLETVKENTKENTIDDIHKIEKLYSGKSIKELDVLFCELIKQDPFSETFVKSSLSKLRVLDFSNGSLESVDLLFYFKNLPVIKEIDFSNNKITRIIHFDFLQQPEKVNILEQVFPKTLKKINLSWNFLTEFPSIELIMLLQKRGTIFDIRFNYISSLPQQFMYEADDALSDAEYHTECKSKSRASKFVSINHHILCDIKNTIPTEILPNLYLGSMQAAKNVRLLVDVLKIKYVLNVSCFDVMEESGFRGKKYSEFFEEILNLQVTDDDKQDIVSIFDQCFPFIDKARKEKNVPILVHCLAGQSRSVSIVIGYVMKELNLDFSKAFAHVKELHTYSQPNTSFQMQLSTFLNEELKEEEEEGSRSPILL